LRSPGPVTPRDVECEGLRNITYTTIAGFDAKVDDSIESFLRSLSQIGPELLCGGLTLSFFERRASRQLFGLVSHEERVM
jgi:Autophagy-related protein 101